MVLFKCYQLVFWMLLIKGIDSKKQRKDGYFTDKNGIPFRGTCDNHHEKACQWNRHCPGKCDDNSSNAGEFCKNPIDCPQGSCIHNRCVKPNGVCANDNGVSCNKNKDCKPYECMILTGFCDNDSSVTCKGRIECPNVCTEGSENAGTLCSRHRQCGFGGKCGRGNCVVLPETTSPSDTPSSPTTHVPSIVTSNAPWVSPTAPPTSASTDSPTASPTAEFSSDFVIVGGGTAGCVLAARLCEDIPGSTVTLLERGAPRNEAEESDVRKIGRAMYTWGNPSLAEAYLTEPEKNLYDPATFSMGRSLPVITGKTLGGTSSINAGQWKIPLNGTIETWDIDGLDTETALKYFNIAFDKVGVRSPPQHLRQNYTSFWFEASKKINFPVIAEPAPGFAGSYVSPVQHASDAEGNRIDSCTAYLKPAMLGKCKNTLTLIQNVTATKILFKKNESSNKEYLASNHAEGVEFVSSNDFSLSNKNIIYGKEIIISAGPFESPKLLQLSGVGPESILKSSGVKSVVADLPVGLNAQGRPLNYVVGMYLGAPLDWSNNETFIDAEASGVAVSDIIGVLSDDAYFESGFKTDPETINQPLSVSPCLGNPSSFGSVYIANTNPFHPPKVSLNLLDSDEEYKRLITCMEFQRSILSAFPPSFGMIELAPNMTTSAQYLSASTTNSYHFVGGSKGALSSNLKVKGINNLRVIDASSIPFIPISAGPMASVYMLAEFMSSKIVLEHHKKE